MATMKDLANLLGLETNEEFKVDGWASPKYRFTDEWLMYYCKIDKTWKKSGNNVCELFTGEKQIKKLPWKPKKGDTYYYVKDDKTIPWEFWEDRLSDYEKYAIGNCFKTKEMAEENKGNLILYLNSMYKNINQKEYIAVNLIKNYCIQQECCDNCIFSEKKDDTVRCKFVENGEPEFW